MVASTKLSQFISARYAPYARWQQLWLSVLSWVSQETVKSIEWTPLVHPHYDAKDAVDNEDYKNAVRLNTEWYRNTGFVLSEKDAADYMGSASGSEYAKGSHNDGNPVDRKLTLGGDGSYGVLEAFVSGASFTVDGSQLMRFWRRADCNGESAGNIALAGVLLNNDEYKQIALNIVDWLLTKSFLSQEDRANPDSAQYGLLAWHDGSAYETYYGDDNAKAVLGLISAVSALRADGFASDEVLDAYDQRILEVILGNFRTTGRSGMRGDSISAGELDANGWEYYYNRKIDNYAPHFEALNLATYLWAYDKTGYAPLLERTKTGIRNLMDAYHNKSWKWTNGLQQERAKMILPLAWLVRIEDTAEHRAWLDEMIEDLMYYRDAETGAIRDAFGEPGEGVGMFGPFTTNSQYGNHEAPVIQKNGDPCIDALYTSSFAMMTLNEAVAATKDATLKAKYQGYSDSLADFFVRIQQVSDNKTHNGVWFRGFDYEKWETYGSDGDAAWGVWCTETGWSQAWISNTLSMKVLNTNIWDYSKNTSVSKCFEETASIMLKGVYDPNDVGDPSITASNYKSGNPELLIDGVYGSTSFNDGKWMGDEGKDITVIVDYKESKTFDKVTLGFIRSWVSGIRVAENVNVYASTDGEEYTLIGTMGTKNAFTEGENTIERLSLDVSDVNARYLKVEVINPGKLPVEHPHSNGGTVPSWMFMDELEIHISQATMADLYSILKLTRPLMIGAYTPETGAALKTARDVAEVVYAKESPSSAEIDEAYTNLREAYEALESSIAVVSMTKSTDGDHKDKLIDKAYATNLDFQNDAYIGWQNVSKIEAIIDLKAEKGISSIGYSVLSRPAWGIYVPNAKISVSNDGSTWKEVGTIDAPAHTGDNAVPVGRKPKLTLEEETVARYVKYEWTTDKEWVFIDEVEIETYDYKPATVTSTNLVKANVLVDKVYGFVPLVDPWRDYWAECEGEDFSFTVDYQDVKSFDRVSLGFLQAFSSGICTPSEAKIYASNDNLTYTLLGTIGALDPFESGAHKINRLSLDLEETNARYLKVEVTNPGTLPDRPGVKSWVFIDEIEIKYEGSTLEELKEVIDSVSNVNIEAYTEESASAYLQAKENAVAIYDSKTATPIQIDQAIKDLESAYHDLALGRVVISMSAGSKDKALLVDDQYAHTFIHTDPEYIGWQNATTFEAIVDLGSEQEIDSVGFSSSSRPQWGIYPPNATVYVSSDNLTWKEVGYLDAPEHTIDVSTAIGVINTIELSDVKGRYVKYVFENDDSHLKESVTAPGTVTRNEWVFIDEVIINDMDITKAQLQSYVEEMKKIDVSIYDSAANSFRKAIEEAEALLAKEEAVISSYHSARNKIKDAYAALTSLPIITYDKPLGKGGANGKYNILDDVYGSMIPEESSKQIFNNGTWAGIEGKDLTVTIQLEKESTFNQLRLGFLQEWRWGIRYPEYVQFMVSEDGINYTEYDKVVLDKEFTDSPSESTTVMTSPIPQTAKYIKIFIKNGGTIPAGHPYAGSPTWFFFDELTFVKDVVKTALEDAVAECISLDRDDYTENSFDELTDVLKEAQIVVADENVDQETVNEMTKRLLAAKEALVDISGLRELVETIEMIDLGQYTEESVEALKEGLDKAYKAMIDGSQEEVDAALENLDQLYSNMFVDYKVIEGANGNWAQGSKEGLTFKANGEIEKFVLVKVDGETVATEHYQVVAGSTVITFTADYLSTLNAGEHTLTVVYEDGIASCTFTIQAKNTDTADTTNNNGWMSLLFGSALAIMVLLQEKKRRKA
ncbi:MAG: discoidin domain-containing protein [Erysipelotrichaceae bacterium]|nr:discoidin domain-containing protein [Erysipelotrichaceae bacterium]